MYNNYNFQKNDEYLTKKWNRKRFDDHMRVGFQYCFFHPFVLTAWIPIVSVMMLIWSKMSFLWTSIDMPEPLHQVYSIIIQLVVFLILPVLLMLIPVEIIGNIATRKDEAEIQMSLPKEALRYGPPILRYKKTDKKTGKTIRVFDSPVKLEVWENSKESICDQMNLRIISIDYNPGMIGLQVRMVSVKNRIPPEQGDLIDEEF